MHFLSQVCWFSNLEGDVSLRLEFPNLRRFIWVKKKEGWKNQEKDRRERFIHLSLLNWKERREIIHLGLLNWKEIDRKWNLDSLFENLRLTEFFIFCIFYLVWVQGFKNMKNYLRFSNFFFLLTSVCKMITFPWKSSYMHSLCSFLTDHWQIVDGSVKFIAKIKSK